MWVQRSQTFSDSNNRLLLKLKMKTQNADNLNNKENLKNKDNIKNVDNIRIKYTVPDWLRLFPSLSS